MGIQKGRDVKLIDETFQITIFEKGKFCWKPGWVKKDHSEINLVQVILWLLLVVLIID